MARCSVHDVTVTHTHTDARVFLPCPYEDWRQSGYDQDTCEAPFYHCGVVPARAHTDIVARDGSQAHVSVWQFVNKHPFTGDIGEIQLVKLVWLT